MISLKFTMIATAYFCTVYGLELFEDTQEPPIYHKLYETPIKEIYKLIRATSKTSACRPRETIVKLNTGFGYEVFPQSVVVNRCSGTSKNNNFSCMPTEGGPVEMAVTGIGAKTQDKFYRVAVEKHTKCMAKCMVKEEHCNENQFYDAAQCQCICNMDEEAECNETDNMNWDRENCKCVCNKKMEYCSSGYAWVPKYCKCMAMK